MTRSAAAHVFGTSASFGKSEADGFLPRLPEGAIAEATHLMGTVAKHLRDEMVRKMDEKALRG